MFRALWLLLVPMLAFYPVTGMAAPRSEPVEKAGALITTPYFSVVIPKGWMMPHPIKKQPLDGISSVFATNSGTLALTINVMKAKMTARELAEQTAANMKKTGLTVTKPRNIRGLWQIGIKGPANGEAWFGSDGQFCSAVTFFGTEFSAANDFLDKIKSGHPDLFPRRITP